MRQLERGLGLVDATSIVLGGIIGASIFLVPAAVAHQVGAPGLALIAWLLSGFLAVFSAMCFAELGAAIPETGGTYAFLKRAFPETPVAFLFGWMMFFAYSTGAIAVVAIMAASYMGQLIEQFTDYGDGTSKAVAVGLIAALTTLNYLGVRIGGNTQAVITFLKVGAILAVIGAALLVFGGEGQPLTPLLPAGASPIGMIEAVGAAMVLSMFSYSGAFFITHVAEEVRRPERNIPLAISISMATVIALYLLLNVAYMHVLPFDELRHSDRVASDMMAAIFGPAGANAMALVVTLSAIGVLNAQLLNYPRIAFALARDGLFFRRVAVIHGRHHTPAIAIILVGLVASVFALSGTYSELLGYVGFVVHFFICLAVVAVMILRRREPDLPRPFKVWGYPFTPLAFLAVSTWYLGNLLINRFDQTVIGILIVGVGLPFYYYWRNRGRSESVPVTSVESSERRNP
jgi:APA family basic amino acid/polyamine antiporter